MKYFAQAEIVKTVQILHRKIAMFLLSSSVAAWKNLGIPRQGFCCFLNAFFGGRRFAFEKLQIEMFLLVLLSPGLLAQLSLYQTQRFQFVGIGEKAEISCTSTAEIKDYEHSYNWYKRQNGEFIPLIENCIDEKSAERYSCRTDGRKLILEIPKVQREDSGLYLCAQNRYSSMLFSNGSSLIVGASSADPPGSVDQCTSYEIPLVVVGLLAMLLLLLSFLWIRLHPSGLGFQHRIPEPPALESETLQEGICYAHLDFPSRSQDGNKKRRASQGKHLKI
ncbi:uncharacterized protein LOC128337301 isoform X3 [Hemicordylus capensis]|uniref:uncharacterized protein LOC128337301 isoform X3 n=1 Tax=Hemicordylus capensis TaxID=884348 RepID=UPI002302A8D7|nr:uncharacterized protein LOC128337301 isoform X3 [Hemicordylus capensis]